MGTETVIRLRLRLRRDKLGRDGCGAMGDGRTHRQQRFVDIAEGVGDEAVER